MPRRIQWRIAIGYVALLTIVMVALGLFLVRLLREQQFREAESQLQREVLLIAVEAQYRLATEGPGAMDPLAKQLGAAAGLRVTIIAPDGTVLGDSDADPAHMENHASRPEIVQALHAGAGVSRRDSATLDRGLIYVAVPMVANGQVLGIVRAALPINQTEAAINSVIAAVAGALVIASLLAVALAVVIARAIARPIGALTDSALRLAHGEAHQPLPVGAGGEVGVLAGAFDEMAERVREHVKSIQDESARLAAMLANIPDGVIITNRAGEIVLVNAAAERMLRLSAVSTGRRLIEVVRDHEIVDLVDQALRPDSVPITRVIDLEAGDSRSSVQAIGVPLPAGPDAESRALLVLQDVTELRRVESVRRDFVANVSHELRTPVASLKAMVETLEGGALDDPAAARDFLARMHVEVDDLIQLIEELLELSRIESGRVTLRLQPLDPGPVVAAVVDRLQTQAQRQGLDLVITMDDDRPRVMIDPERLQQVVMNLVHNAIKFTDPGGAVMVQVGRNNGEVRVRIRDTGVGIAPDELGRVFERFYKVDRSRSSGGTGLGLAIAKHLTQAHGGRVWAESAGPGRGATFIVALPAIPTAPKSPSREVAGGEGARL